MLTVNVIGIPQQQGSKKGYYNPQIGRVQITETNKAKLKPWRAEVTGCVAQAMADTGWTTLDEPVEVEIAFYHPRPKGHYGTGRNAGVLKPTAPEWKSTSPDIDKLTRAVLDALTASRVFRDDARVARLVVEDRWADAATGARITVRALAPTPAPAGAASTTAPALTEAPF